MFEVLLITSLNTRRWILPKGWLMPDMTLAGSAAREAFEEAGVLLARTPAGRPLRVDEPAVVARFDAHRRALHAGGCSLLDVLEAEGLVLSVDQVQYVAHWITPAGEPRRFDTRFFLSRAPEGQAFGHDDVELIGSEWVRPADALARHQAGSFPLIGPTIRSLADLGRFATTDALLAAPRPVHVGAGTS